MAGTCLVVYDGEEPCGVFRTYEEAAAYMGVSVASARFYASPISKRRTEARIREKCRVNGGRWIIERVDV